MDTAERLFRLVRAWRTWDPKATVAVHFGADPGREVEISPSWVQCTVTASTMEEALDKAERELKRQAAATVAQEEGRARDARDRSSAAGSVLAEGSA